MAYLTEENIKEIACKSLENRKAIIKRYDSFKKYTLIKTHKHGMQGVVWKAKDELGDDFAIKIIPEESYCEHSMIDEITEASKLGSDFFARIDFFGDIIINSVSLQSKYKAIITEWIEGISFKDFALKELKNVNTFLNLITFLFTAIAILRDKKLCHDDLHPDNVLVYTVNDPLTKEKKYRLKIIDTGSIKRIETRNYLLNELRNKINILKTTRNHNNEKFNELIKLYEWKKPDDHIRALDNILYAANALCLNYYGLDSWEKMFVDKLLTFFQKASNDDLERRLDDPEKLIMQLNRLREICENYNNNKSPKLSSPFDYISAEMITNDKEFAYLFSKECPWLKDCQNLEPIYIYGPRGCGKSSVLRWLSFKTILSDPNRKIDDIREVGVYLSCSVELRSRFWLFNEKTIDNLQVHIIRFFNLLLIEELFDTLRLIIMEDTDSNILTIKFSKDVIKRLTGSENKPRLQGQNVFEHLKYLTRSLRWETWANIQQNKIVKDNPDPSLVTDICKLINEYFIFFKDRYIIFLIDDYSNQRIPEHLQKKLNQTISFAKQGIPIFKVSSEYDGVNLEGIQEGREVFEINIGEKYTNLDSNGYIFISDILNRRLEKAGYKGKVERLLGKSGYSSFAKAIATEKTGDPFYYHGIDCIHNLCSGDVALAINLIKRIFDEVGVDKDFIKKISPSKQHKIIQRFSHDEVRRIKNIVHFGEKMYDIIYFLGYLAGTIVMNQKSKRADKSGDPICKTHIDVRMIAIRDLESSASKELFNLYKVLKSKAILFSLETSRSRLSGETDRLQIRRIYLPAFKAPLKRDVPIKIDTKDDLISLLTNPRTFTERELKKSDISVKEFKNIIKQTEFKFME